MSDDHPDDGPPSDPRPSGRIRIVGATPATGEHPTVAAQRPPSDPPPPAADPPTADPPAADPPAAEPPPAEDPNRFGAIPIIADDDEPVADPTPARPAPETPEAPAAAEPPVRAVPDPEPPAPAPAAPDLDDLDLPPTEAVPVVADEPSPAPAPTPAPARDLDDIRVWAAPDDDEDAVAIEAGRSASDNPFADLIGDPEDGLDDLLGPPEDDLPHWSEPVAGATDDEDAFAGVSGGPRWRGQGEETGEPEDFSDLIDEETRVESLGEDEMTFDDLDPAVAAAAIDSPAGPPQRRNPFPDAPEDEFGGNGDGGGGSGGGSGRDMQQAVIVGVGLVVLMAVSFLIGAWAVVALATAVVVLATAEFFTATRRSGYHPAPLIGLAGSGGMVLAAYLRGEGGMVLVFFLVVVVTLCWWLFDAGPGDHAVANAGITMLGVFYVGGLGAFASLLLRIDDSSVSASGALVSGFGDSVGRSLLFAAILVTVAADLGGLFVGQRMGRSPLTAASPNKTVEGFVGGIVASVVVSVLVLGIIGVGPWTAIDALVLGVVGGIMAPLGDLCESRLKRDLGLKDMGTLLPGHGGVLHRFDALLFVLPATYYVVRLLEVYANTP